MTNENIICLREVSKDFERKIALSSLSLCIKRGEAVALIGPSGAGKTTLVNILANILKPDSGEVLIGGIPIEKYKSNKQLANKIGVIRQQYDLVDQLPVIHNVLAGRLSKWSFIKSILSLVIPQEKELVVKALNRVGIPDKMYEQTAVLSGGEKQRAALARLLLQKPEIVLADEPVSALDPARAEDILVMLLQLAKEEGQTLIAILHSVEYAKKYFNRIIGMRDGRIFFDLPAEAVTEKNINDIYDLREIEAYD